MIQIFLLLLLCIASLTSCRQTTASPVTIVDEGKFFRSGQPSKNELDNLIRTKGIRTVINLRGTHPGQKWFDDEFNLTETKQVRFISLDFELNHLPHRRTLRQYLDAIENSPKPILIHCDNGVERTGEAAAIYELAINKKTKAEAMVMLSSAYNYDESDDPTKKHFIEKVWQNEEWAKNIYDPCVQTYAYYSHDLPECKDKH